MKLLGFDTSSVACSVGLIVDGRLVERYEEKARQHTRILMPMIRSCLDEAGVELRGLDAIVVGNGPGSFIGMRIAASVAQGLACGAALEIVPVSSMAAVAAAAGSVGDNVVVTQDAHMNEVYLGIYRIDSDGIPQPVMDERLHGQDSIAEIASLSGRVVAAGFGWQRYPAVFEANRASIDAMSDVLHPRAAEVLHLGAAAFEDNRAIAPESLDPAYLRQKVAARPSGRTS